MRISRTVLALLTLILGVVALLVLRYDPEVYARLLDHPILMALLVGLLALIVAVQITYHARDPKRAVVFKGGRFDRLDPRGDILLWPGTDVGSEVSLAEHRVLGWPVMVYDIEGKEQSIIFALTWRIVPTSTHPETERERRMLMMSNDERRRIVIQELEYIVRDIARVMTIDQLKVAFTVADRNQTNERTIEAVRNQLLVRLRPDALTVDRLHVVRFIPPEKKDEPKPYREKRTIKETQDWHSHTDREADGPRFSPCERDCRCGCHSACACDAHRRCGCACGCGCDSAGHRSCDCECHRRCACDAHHNAKRDDTGHREIKREEELVRGAQDKNGGDGGSGKPSLEPKHHRQIMQKIIEGIGDGSIHVDAGTSGRQVLDKARGAKDVSGSALETHIQTALKLLEDMHGTPVLVDRAVENILGGLEDDDVAKVRQTLGQKAQAFKDQGEKALAGACELAAKVVSEGSATIYAPHYYATQKVKPRSGEADTAVRQVLCDDVKGALCGYLEGTAMGKLASESPMLASGLNAQDCGIARSLEMSAAAVAHHFKKA